MPLIPDYIIEQYRAGILKQLEQPLLADLLRNGPLYGPHQKHDLRPIYGPREPKRMLVRDLIKRLSAFDPDDEVRIGDCEYGPLVITNVQHREYSEGYRPIVIVE